MCEPPPATYQMSERQSTKGKGWSKGRSIGTECFDPFAPCSLDCDRGVREKERNLKLWVTEQRRPLALTFKSITTRIPALCPALRAAYQLRFNAPKMYNSLGLRKKRKQNRKKTVCILATYNVCYARSLSAMACRYLELIIIDKDPVNTQRRGPNAHLKKYTLNLMALSCRELSIKASIFCWFCYGSRHSLVGSAANTPPAPRPGPNDSHRRGDLIQS